MSESRQPCGACKMYRRKCTEDCVFAPHFPPDDHEKFEVAHKVFGASNVGKLLSALDASERALCVESLVFEAQARIHNPMYGCLDTIFLLQQYYTKIALELKQAKEEMASYEALYYLQQQVKPCRGHVHGGPMMICEPQEHEQRQQPMLYENYDQQQASYIYDDNLGSNMAQVQQVQGIGDHHNMQEDYQNLSDEDYLSLNLCPPLSLLHDFDFEF